MASDSIQIMVSMDDLRDVINAAAMHANGSTTEMRDMLRYQEDPSNPIVKLRNQYAAAIELYQTQPVDGVQ